jgi:hypothetical protein
MKILCENMLVPSHSNWLDLLRIADLIKSKHLFSQVICFLRNNFSALEIILRNVDDENYNNNNNINNNINNDENSIAKNESKYAIDEDEKINFFECTSIQLKINNNNNNNNNTEKNNSKEQSLYTQKNEEYESILKQFNNEFPHLIEKIIQKRKIFNPLPPSNVYLKSLKQNKVNDEKNLINKKKSIFPLWSLFIAAFCLILFQNVSAVVSMGYWIPIINISVFLIFIYIAFIVVHQKS